MACPTGDLVITSKDPRINYNLLPGQKLETCPYNASHGILPIKFARHVANCHRLHLKDQAAKGGKSLFSICQYDRAHHVPNELLAHHEANCESLATYKNGGWEPWEGAGAVTDDKKPGVPDSAFKPQIREPPKIEARANNDEEDWDAEPGYGIKFDANKQIHDLRTQGYSYIKTHDVIGLTKSEKKEFYANEAEALKTYKKHHQFASTRNQEGASDSALANFSRSRRTVGSMTSAVDTMYGEESTRMDMGELENEFQRANEQEIEKVGRGRGRLSGQARGYETTEIWESE